MFESTHFFNALAEATHLNKFQTSANESLKRSVSPLPPKKAEREGKYFEKKGQGRNLPFFFYLCLSFSPSLLRALCSMSSLLPFKGCCSKEDAPNVVAVSNAAHLLPPLLSFFREEVIETQGKRVATGGAREEEGTVETRFQKKKK